MIYSYFSHPNSVCMSYYTHLSFSLKLSRKLFVGTIKAFLHAIFPNIFITSSSDLLEELQNDFQKVGCKKEHNEKITYETYDKYYYKFDENVYPNNLYPTDINKSLQIE